VEIVGFRGPKFKYQQGGIVLNEHGRIRPKEQEVERGQKNGTGVPCHVARPCHVYSSERELVAARVCLGWQFFSWRLGFFSKGKTLNF